jgi:hypothetical protein
MLCKSIANTEDIADTGVKYIADADADSDADAGDEDCGGE